MIATALTNYKRMKNVDYILYVVVKLKIVKFEKKIMKHIIITPYCHAIVSEV